MVTIIVCTYNRADRITKMLDSIAMMTPPSVPWELIIVDNNCSDGTAKVVTEFAAKAPFPVIHVFEGKQGLSHARNAGIAAAKGEIIVFTDDDVTVDKNWLPEIVKVFEEWRCVALSGRIVATWEFPRPRWLQLLDPIVHFTLGEETIETTTTGLGANMAFRKEAFAEHGVFRTDLGRTKDALTSGEETEFFQRLLRANAKLVYAAQAIVYHPVEEERVQKDYLRRWYFALGRSRMRTEGIPSGAILYFGIPRYLIRNACTHFARWLIAIDPAKRFCSQAQLYFNAGKAYESRRLRMGILEVRAAPR